MMSSSWLDPVRLALDELDNEPLPLFFRDDDAGWDDESLFELLAQFENRGLPIDLAVIPTELDNSLAANLSVRHSCGLVGLHQHGFSHTNHESVGRKHEFGPSRNFEQQHLDIGRGIALLSDHLGSAPDPIFTPPWNRCTPVTAAVLSTLGFEVLSQDSTAPSMGVTGLRTLPVTVDWLGSTHGVRWSIEEVGNRLAARFRADTPTGVMLHHAAMNTEDRLRLGEFLDLVSIHPSVVAMPMRQVARWDGAPRLARTTTNVL